MKIMGTKYKKTKQNKLQFVYHTQENKTNS